MQSAPLTPLDLPLKVLIWASDDYQTKLSHTAPGALTMPDRGDPLVTALGMTNSFGCVWCREIGGKEVRRAGQAQVKFGEGAYPGFASAPPAPPGDADAHP
jgi:hypothetical protein